MSCERLPSKTAAVAIKSENDGVDVEPESTKRPIKREEETEAGTTTNSPPMNPKKKLKSDQPCDQNKEPEIRMSDEDDEDDDDGDPKNRSSDEESESKSESDDDEKKPPTMTTPTSVMVEFKFTSYKTYLFNIDDFQGTLHVTMDQDPKTGLFSIPNDTTTPFHVKLNRESLQKAKRWNMGKGEPDHFDGAFRKGKNHKMKDFFKINTGLELDFYTVSSLTSFQCSVRPKDTMNSYPEKRTGGIFETSQDISAHKVDLDRWEKDQGGFLDITASANYSWTHENRNRFFGASIERRRTRGYVSIVLHTVLSAYKPNQAPFQSKDGDDSGPGSFPQYDPNGPPPDWGALVNVVAARQTKPEKDLRWAQRAVQQYRYYLDLHKDKKGNFKEAKQSPSDAVDKIWQSHLCFLDRYQRDIIQLYKGTGYLEHNPIHMTKSLGYYKRAYKEHKKRMDKIGEPIDEEFWPIPPDKCKSLTCTSSITGYVESSYNTWKSKEVCESWMS